MKKELINSTLSDTEEYISDLEDRIMEITQSEQQKDNQIFKMTVVKETSGTTSSIPTFALWGSQKEKRKRKDVENVFDEIMAEDFPNLKKETDVQVQEEQRVTDKRNTNRPTPRHIIIKMQKLKVKGVF